MALHFWLWRLLILLLTASFSPLSKAAVTPIGVWPMSLASGRDVSGNHNHGVPTGRLVFVNGMEGIPKTAADFSGTGRQIAISKLNGMTGGSFTVGAYIRVSEAGPSTNYPIVSFQTAGTNSSVCIFGVTTYFKLRVYLGKTDYKTLDAINPNTWTFVAISYNSDNGYTRIWIQDKLAVDQSVTPNSISTIGGALIGGNYATSGDLWTFQGLISCVVLYGSAIGQLDIQAAKRTCTLYDNSAMFSNIGAGLLPTGATLRSLKARSAVDCSGECFANQSCQSCSFSSLNEMCHLGNQVMDSSQLTTSGDFKTYNFGAKL